MNYTDDVRGIVVGGDDGVLYKFYTVVPPDVPHYLGDGLFSSDTEAEAHCRTAYPDAYARGIEMRVFDTPRCTCPCLDCIEGAHCGGVYRDDGATIGECHEVVDDGPVAGY